MHTEFYDIANVAKNLNNRAGHINTTHVSFTKPDFKNPNSYVNLLGDIIWIKDNVKCDVTKDTITRRCNRNMNYTVDRLVGAGFIQRVSRGVYTPTLLGRVYFNLAKTKFVDNVPTQLEFDFTK